MLGGTGSIWIVILSLCGLCHCATVQINAGRICAALIGKLRHSYSWSGRWIIAASAAGPSVPPVLIRPFVMPLLM